MSIAFQLDVENKLLTWLTVIPGPDCWTSRSVRHASSRSLCEVSSTIRMGDIS
jgi:hypothetical protein